ncbi:MAG: hypothetical protein ACXWG0_07530 [Chthoniobacterales bacterium]
MISSPKETFFAPQNIFARERLQRLIVTPLQQKIIARAPPDLVTARKFLEQERVILRGITSIDSLQARENEARRFLRFVETQIALQKRRRVGAVTLEDRARMKGQVFTQNFILIEIENVDRLVADKGAQIRFPVKLLICVVAFGELLRGTLRSKNLYGCVPHTFGKNLWSREQKTRRRDRESDQANRRRKIENVPTSLLRKTSRRSQEQNRSSGEKKIDVAFIGAGEAVLPKNKPRDAQIETDPFFRR